MTFLTKTDLLTEAERRYDEFPVMIRGEKKTCRIQSLTEKERSDYEAATEVAKSKETKAERTRDMKRRLIVLCVVDENNRPLLSMADIHALEKVDSQITSTIFNKCVDHVGFTDSDIEELAGNSEDISAA